MKLSITCISVIVGNEMAKTEMSTTPYHQCYIWIFASGIAPKAKNGILSLLSLIIIMLLFLAC